MCLVTNERAGAAPQCEGEDPQRTCTRAPSSIPAQRRARRRPYRRRKNNGRPRGRPFES